MVTRRVPIAYERQPHLTPTPIALAAFRRWLKLGEHRCDCEEHSYWWLRATCAVCEEAFDQQMILFHEFDCFPWELGWAVIYPDAGAADSKWDALARERYAVLMAALEHEHASANTQ